MKRTITAATAGICIIALLTGCETRSDGSRMTLSEQWNAMAARQDAAAREFVNARGETRHPDRPASRASGAPGAPAAPTEAIPTPYSRAGANPAEPTLY